MTHGSLFSGIGGFDLAAEWMGWDNKFHCEWNEFGQKVLKYYWPNAELFTDITKSDFTKYANKIDVLTGGFPCQPYSTAGKRLGKEDERHLWPHMLRTIQEVKPRWVVGENVRGLISWNGGLVFEEVQTDLEANGYEVQSFLLPACGVNAPHRRDRIWFIAHSNHKGRISGLGQVQKKNGEVSQRNNDAKFGHTSNWDVTNTIGIRLQKRGKAGDIQSEKGKALEERGKSAISIETNGGRYCPIKWEDFPTVAPICNGDDGLSTRLDSITFPKWRNESIKAGGNAIVPQVVYQIFKTIEQYEQQRASV
jgi:DNA (cytosine-5)-methyltransferase 1